MYEVLMFQETKCDDAGYDFVKKALNRLGFKIFLNNQKRLSNVSSEGLIICVKHKWENPVHYYDMSCEFVMWLRVTVDGNNDLLLGNVYIPPSGSPYSDSEGFNRVSAELDRLTCSKNIHVCLTGDFNARCGVKSEYVQSDVEPLDFDVDPILYRTLLNQREINDKGSPCKRVSSDHQINEYGNRLI